jgi:hypothetical protein
MHYFYPFYSFNTVAVEDFFPQRHSRYPEIKIVYRYGERFYSADAVDRVFENAAEELHVVQTRAVAGESAAVTTRVAEAVAAVVAVTATTEHTIDNYPNVTNSNSNCNSSKNSPRSVSSSASHTGASTTGGGACSGSRAIGKRNQQFYLPDGYVKLLHASIDPACGDSSADGGASGASHAHKWHGRYDKLKNTITRTTAEYDAPDSVDIAEYETLSHFAQEHDKECWGNDYTPSNTHNVWKNPNFLYFNTVSLKWEPLNKLR